MVIRRTAESLRRREEQVRDLVQNSAERAVRESEERFRALVQHSSDVVAVLDTDSTITWLSPAVEGMLGLRADALCGRPAVEFVHPGDREAAEARLSGVLEHRLPARSLTVRVQDAAGEWRWLGVVGTNQLDNPSLRGIVVNFRDITERVLAEEALQESEARFRSLAHSSPVGIFQQDADGTCTFVNERWQLITGVDAVEALSTGWRHIVHADDLGRIDPVRRTGGPKRPFNEVFRISRGGRIRWVSMQATSMVAEDGTLLSHIGTIEDVTDRVEALRDSERLTNILEATTDLVGIATADGRLNYLNVAARQFVGLGPDDDLRDALGNGAVPPWVAVRLRDEIRPILFELHLWSGELDFIDRDGLTVPMSVVMITHRDEAGRVEFISAIARDISERKLFEARLEHQATHDPLTGLPNRALLLDRLTVAFARASRHHRSVALLFCDLDNFKVINDSLGHALGDLLLQRLAERLSATLRPGDTVARFGGDEFVILCEDLDDEDEAAAIAERAAAAVRKPVVIGDAEVFITVSTGIAFAGAAHPSPDELLRDADAAMYRAKARGRSRFEVFDAGMRTMAVDRLEVENDLRRAVERRELRLHYQPKIDLRTGRIAAVEALLRWEHPERGLLAPADFLSVAEESGLIVPIGAWTIRQGCRDAARWRASRPDSVVPLLWINASARQLARADLADELREAMATNAIEADRVGIEITEHVLMDDVDTTQILLERLKALGVLLAVDDFGTGYSSLIRLRRFPVDLLKIDQAFVQGLGRDPEDSAIVAAVVSLAHTLGMQAIAEGVETPDQLAELRVLGCDMAQGFLMSQPVPAEKLTELLLADPRW
ncbi:hypothetical protein BH24ACT3_BH24ACT3_00030 [soil metagenome]